MVTISDLERFTDAWNDHDIDTLMSYMDEDCLFLTGGGKGPSGTKFEGLAAVRERFERVRRWQVENQRHRMLDVVFNEDSSRARRAHSAALLVVLRQ